MLNYKLKVGILPIRRWIKEPPKRIGMFQSDYAAENKRALVPFIKANYGDEQTEFVDVDWLNDEGLLYCDSDCERVAEYFREQKVDALIVLACNFGNEYCAGRVASLVRVPVLLYGPRDCHFDTVVRYTDTQCGLFAMSKQFRRAGVPFSYIENCVHTAPQFDEGVRRFLGVACMVKNFRNMHIVALGARLKPFKSIMYNELELAERFGIDVTTLNLAEALAELDRIFKEERAALAKEAAELKGRIDCSSVGDEALEKMLAVVHYYEKLSRDYDCSLISAECWTGLTVGWGVGPCLAMSLLADRGIYATCEGDIHMTITNALLAAATRGKEAPIQGEFTCRHPANDNAELLWHCGVFPLRYKAEGAKAELYGGKPSFRLRDGEYTIARFQADRGKYFLAGGKFRTCEGPETFGTYLWAEFKDLPKLERKLIEGPYIHHMSEIPGDYTEYLKDFARFTEGVEYDPLED